MNATARTIKADDHIYVRGSDRYGTEHFAVYRVLKVEHDPVNGICDEAGCDGWTFQVEDAWGQEDHLHAHLSEIELVTALVRRAQRERLHKLVRDPVEVVLDRVVRDLTIAGFAGGGLPWHVESVLREAERQLYDVRHADVLDE